MIITEENATSSATQVGTFELCPRKWALKYIDRIEAEANKFADLGINTHGKLERWLRAGVPPEIDATHRDEDHRKEDERAVKLAQALIPYLPPPQAVKPLDVENDQILRVGGIDFFLKVDLFMPKWTGDMPWIFDHKTTKDPARWALTPELMPLDIAASIYGVWGLLKSKADAVTLQWNYVKSIGTPHVTPVVQTVTGRMIRDRVSESIETSRMMAVIRESGITGMEVPFDASGCNAYGGCPYKKICNLSANDEMVSIMSQGTTAKSGETKAFLARLQARKNGTTVAPPTAAPQHVNPPEEDAGAAGAAEGSENPFLAKMRARKGAAAAPASAPATPAPTAPTETVLAAAEPKKGRKAAAAAPAPAPEPAADPVQDAWLEYSKVALGALVGQVEPAEAADVAAQYADAMVGQFAERRG